MVSSKNGLESPYVSEDTTPLKASSEYDEESAQRDRYAAADAYLAEYETEYRHGFIRKVYSMLSLQLLLTAGISLIFMRVEAARHFVLQTTGGIVLFWTSLAFTFVLLFVMFFIRHSFPSNMILLFVWTGIMSMFIGLTCSRYDSEIVLQALCVTSVVILSLTLLVLLTNINFGVLGHFLFGSLLILFFLLIIQIFFPFGGWMFYLYCSLGCLVFAGYVIFDTWRMREIYSETDDWVLACINLWLDYINLFLFILRLIGKK